MLENLVLLLYITHKYEIEAEISDSEAYLLASHFALKPLLTVCSLPSAKGKNVKKCFLRAMHNKQFTVFPILIFFKYS